MLNSPIRLNVVVSCYFLLFLFVFSFDSFLARLSSIILYLLILCGIMCRVPMVQSLCEKRYQNRGMFRMRL